MLRYEPNYNRMTRYPAISCPDSNHEFHHCQPCSTDDVEGHQDNMLRTSMEIMELVSAVIVCEENLEGRIDEATQRMGPLNKYQCRSDGPMMKKTARSDDDENSIVHHHHHNGSATQPANGDRHCYHEDIDDDDDVSHSFENLVHQPTGGGAHTWRHQSTVPSDSSTIPGLVSFRSGSFVTHHTANSVCGGTNYSLSSTSLVSVPTSEEDSVSSLDRSHPNGSLSSNPSSFSANVASFVREIDGINYAEGIISSSRGLDGVFANSLARSTSSSSCDVVFQPKARISESLNHAETRWGTNHNRESKDAAPSYVRSSRRQDATTA